VDSENLVKTCCNLRDSLLVTRRSSQVLGEDLGCVGQGVANLLHKDGSAVVTLDHTRLHCSNLVYLEWEVHETSPYHVKRFQEVVGLQTD
jgi:hypothetical protein